MVIGLEAAPPEDSSLDQHHNEVWNNVMSQKGEPHAEARVASEPSAHHLTILSQPLSSDVKNKSQSAGGSRKGQRKLPSVYSQDFRILKILPHDLDNINDIEGVSNKIQLKMDDNLPMSLPPPTISTSSSSTTSTTSTKDNQIIDIENNLDYPSSSIPLHREDFRIDDAAVRTELENAMVETALPTVDQPVYTVAAPTIFAQNITTWEDRNEDPTNVFDSSENEMSPQEPMSGEVEVFDRRPFEGNNEINEDYQIVDTSSSSSSSDASGESIHIVAVPPKSAQLTHGFLATAGYPKFYIGDSNCSWKLIAPQGHQIRITVLDINLRCKFL